MAGKRRSPENFHEIVRIQDSSTSSDSEDETPIPVKLPKGRRKMPVFTDAIDMKTSALPGSQVYTSQFLKYRESRSKMGAAARILKDKPGSDVNEEVSNIFTKGPKVHLGRQKILAESDPEDDVEIVGLSSAPERSRSSKPSPVEDEIPKVTKISAQTTSILREFEEIESVLHNPKIAADKSSSFEIYEIDEVREITVKVRWRGSVIRFTTMNDQPFSTILPKLAKEIGVEETEIVLSLEEVTIKPSDTPDGLKLSAIDILDCYVIKRIIEVVEDENVIELKLQSENRWKKIVKIHMESPMEKLIEECATEKGIPASKILFKFDGEVIDPSESPADLDLESGLCIDVTFLP